jgi:hypothetical protein
MRVSAPVLIWRDSALPFVSLSRTGKKKWQRSWRKESWNLEALESCHLWSLSRFNRITEEEIRYGGNQESFRNGRGHDG